MAEKSSSGGKTGKNIKAGRNPPDTVKSGKVIKVGPKPQPSPPPPKSS